MNKRKKELTNVILAILGIAFLAVLIGHIVSVISFNQKEHTIIGSDDTQPSYMSFGNREDSTSAWLKRDFDLNGELVDLSAQTFDGTFFNHAANPVSSWKMRIEIQDDCFINNAWCGTVEIHQHVNAGGGTTQTLDLRDYQLEEVKLEYLYDGDLLIPLEEGDYIVYYPSEKDDEIPIDANSELTIGMIFYYLDDIDLSNFSITYQYHKDYTEGIGFYTLLVLAFFIVAVLLAKIVASVTYKRAWKEMEIRKSGISYMSGIYDLIYIVDIAGNQLTPVKKSTKTDDLFVQNGNAGEVLLDMFYSDVAEEYQTIVKDYMDLTTLEERMDNLHIESIICEYLSISKGWCQARFFTMDRAEGQPLNKVIFAIQNINNEKLAMNAIQENVSKNDTDVVNTKGFLEGVYQRVDGPAREIIDLAEQISNESEKDSVRESAGEIRKKSSSLLQLFSKIYYVSELSAGMLTNEEKEYFVREMLLGIIKRSKEAAEQKKLSFQTDISADIPAKLIGDPEKLQMVISYLLANAVQFTEKGTISLSVYGKNYGQTEHLLFTVKDTGSGIRPDEEKYGLGINIVKKILRLMGAELHVISSENEGSEFYFEFNQTIADPTPIGQIESEQKSGEEK